MNQKISVVIPTYNSWKTLIPCVKSVFNQSLKPFEVIIVDNASTDETLKKIQKLKVKSQIYNLKIKIFKNSKNLGVTGGRNRGIRQASKNSDFVFFFDHDMDADYKMLEELVKVANSDLNVGIVTPKIYYWADKKRIWSAGTGMNLWTGQVLFRGGKDIGQYEKIEEVQVAPAAMLVKKDVIRKIREFDDRYFATYEDTDFCFRAKKKGYVTYYAPKAIAFHKLSTDRTDEINRLLSRAYWVGRNRILFMKDFGKSFIIFLILYPIFLFYYLFIALKNNKFKEAFNFIKGSLDGIVLR